MYFRHKCCWWQLTICAIYLVIIDVSCVDDDNYRTSPEQQQHHAASDEHNGNSLIYIYRKLSNMIQK